MKRHSRQIDKTLAGHAREEAKRVADRYGILDEFRDGLVQGVSELAANAVLYGGGIKELRFEPIRPWCWWLRPSSWRCPLYVAVYVVQPEMLGRNPDETVYIPQPDATSPDGATGTADYDLGGHGIEVVAAFAREFEFTAKAVFPARLG